MAIRDDIPPHTTPSLQDIEDFLMQPFEGESPYADIDLSKYETDHFQYTRRYMKGGVSRFSEIARAILMHKPFWVKFVVEYVGYDIDEKTGERHSSLFKLSHLMNSWTNNDGFSDDEYAHRMAAGLIEHYAGQYCRQNGILTYPNPRLGAAATGGFGGAFGDLIACAKADGVLIAGHGI